jgi:hypothetical protein
MMEKRGKAAKWAARSERLSAALRENLKRRKEQVRARARGEEPGQHEPSAQQTGNEAVLDSPPNKPETGT